jgi:hypothetical protein
METIDDIVREMRKMGENYSKSQSNDCRYVAYWLGTTFADRIEAVAKTEITTPTCKESLQVGNAEKMREALRQIELLLNVCAKTNVSMAATLATISEVVKSSVSAPARNCDLYKTESERRTAFIDWYNETFDLKGSKYAIDTCDLKHNVDGILHEYIEWLFAEAKGEAK